MTQSPKPESIRRLGAGPFLPPAMVAGMQLAVFTPLGRGLVTAQEVADELGVGVTRLEPLLYALVAADLLTFYDGRFAKTAKSDRCLVKRKPSYLNDLHLHYAARYQAVLQTAETTRTGEPQARNRGHLARAAFRRDEPDERAQAGLMPPPVVREPRRNKTMAPHNHGESTHAHV